MENDFNFKTILYKFFYIISAIFGTIGFWKLWVYATQNDYIDDDKGVNVYVGGDAYNYIINSTKATAYFIVALIFVILGSVVYMAYKMETTSIKIINNAETNISNNNSKTEYSDSTEKENKSKSIVSEDQNPNYTLRFKYLNNENELDFARLADINGYLQLMEAVVIPKELKYLGDNKEIENKKYGIKYNTNTIKNETKYFENINELNEFLKVNEIFLNYIMD